MGRRKANKIEVYNLSAVEVYKLVLTRELKRFPRQFWGLPKGLNNAREITKYLIEEVLKWDRETMCEKMEKKVFEQYCLSGMLQLLFRGNHIYAIDYAYPNEFKYWEFKRIPEEYWNQETTSEAVKWLIEEKLKWTEEDVKKNLCARTFRQNGLSGLFSKVFNDSPYQAINSAYPNKYKPWELRHVGSRFWNKNSGIEAVKWLIEEKLEWTREEILENLTVEVFEKYNLKGMLHHVFNTSIFEALDHAYPNRFMPWEFINSSIGSYNRENSFIKYSAS